MRPYYINPSGWFSRDSWYELPSPPKDEGGDYTFWRSHDGFKLIKRT